MRRASIFWVGLWDFLFLVLILFPFLTGGIWIRRPGLFIELSDLGVPVLLMAFLAVVLKLGLNIPLECGVVVKVFKKAWTRWQEALSFRPSHALWMAAAAVGSVWSIASITRHWGLGSHSFDLGIFTNAIWNLTQGNGYISAPKDGINLFLDHQSPLFWLCAPFFYLAPRPETLLVLQGFGLAAGGVALFYLARQYSVRSWVPAALPLLYWAYRPLRNANAFDFHPEVFMLPLFLWAIVGLQEKAIFARRLGVLALVLALGAKESSGPIAAGIGLAWLCGAAPAEVRQFTQRMGAVLIVVGVVVFIWDLRVVPKILGGQYAYNSLYQQFGSGLGDLVLAPFQKPALFWSHIFGGARLKYLFWTLAPLGFLPLLNWRVFVAAIPGYLMLFLSAGDHRVNIQYHYVIEPGVALFWALPGALSLKKKTWIFLWVIFWAAGTFGRSEMAQIRRYWPDAHAQWLTREVIPCVDSEVSIAASEALVPHLSTRWWIHQLPGLRTAVSHVSCVIDDTAVSNWGFEADAREKLLRDLPGLGYREEFACGTLRIWRREGDGASCLRCVPKKCH